MVGELFLADANENPENKDFVRSEEPTKAVTPDKLDRSLREPAKKSSKPCPLTEEKATPNTPRSEKERQSGRQSRTKRIPRTGGYDSRGKRKEDPVADYNRLVHHPRKG